MNNLLWRRNTSGVWFCTTEAWVHVKFTQNGLFKLDLHEYSRKKTWMAWRSKLTLYWKSMQDARRRNQKLSVMNLCLRPSVWASSKGRNEILFWYFSGMMRVSISLAQGQWKQSLAILKLSILFSKRIVLKIKSMEPKMRTYFPICIHEKFLETGRYYWMTKQQFNLELDILCSFYFDKFYVHSFLQRLR